MDRVKGGHLELLALLFERHHRRTFGFFLRLCGDRQTAEDLTQDLFLQVLRSRETWQEGRPFLPWLFQIARNLRIPGGTDEVQRTTIAETLGLRFDASKSAPAAKGG